MMKNNDVLRSLRYVLDMSESAVGKTIALTGHSLDKQSIISMLKKEDESGYAECADLWLSAFLDGLIIRRRGPSLEHAAETKQPERLDNNVVLRKLRIAFELKDEDIMVIMDMAGFGASKPEVNALFRRPDHKNFRPCGDQFLRNFLKGLSIKLRDAK